MIVLDASVLIAHVEPGDGHHDSADAMLRSATRETLGISPISLGEFYVGPARAGVLDRAERVVRELQLAVIPLDADSPRRLAELRSTVRLMTPDCCVLLAAEQTGAAVAAFDERLLSRARALGLRTVDTAA